MTSLYPGMLDAYTEGPGTTQGLSDSEKFKEGYVKKGKGKVKNPPKKTVEVNSWLVELESYKYP